MTPFVKELKEKNIAEYLLYMWMDEDLIRANGADEDLLERNVVLRYPPEEQETVRQWYKDLLQMMLEEGVREKGHLQINRNVVAKLTELHLSLSNSPRFPMYASTYFKALPFIVELRGKQGATPLPEIETCLEALYGWFMLRLQKKEVSEATQKALQPIVNLISLLANYYAKDRRGEIKWEE